MCSNEKSVRDMLQQDKQAQDAMAHHVRRFVGDNGFFSPKTVTQGLEKIHGQKANLKGPTIAAFNSAHAGNWKCPFGSTEFKADKINGYAKYLHLGTTRIWTVDGSIDEARWQQFVDATTAGQEHVVGKYVTKSALKAYLDQCFYNDPQETNTARNAFSWFSSAHIQVLAASKAWDEVFERLTCGWVINQDGTASDEPYIDLDLVRLFFEDSDAAFLMAERQQLPVAKPNVVEEAEELNGLTI